VDGRLEFIEREMFVSSETAKRTLAEANRSWAIESG